MIPFGLSERGCFAARSSELSQTVHLPGGVLLGLDKCCAETAWFRGQQAIAAVDVCIGRDGQLEAIAAPGLVVAAAGRVAWCGARTGRTHHDRGPGRVTAGGSGATEIRAVVA